MAMLMAQSKAFDTIRHGPPIATLYSHGFIKDPPKLTNSYFSNGRHKTKINNLLHSKTRFIKCLSPSF